MINHKKTDVLKVKCIETFFFNEQGCIVNWPFFISVKVNYLIRFIHNSRVLQSREFAKYIFAIQALNFSKNVAKIILFWKKDCYPF